MNGQRMAVAATLMRHMSHYLGFLPAHRQSAPPGLASSGCMIVSSVLPFRLVVVWFCPSELTAVQRRARARMLQSYPASRRYSGEVVRCERPEKRGIGM